MHAPTKDQLREMLRDRNLHIGDLEREIAKANQSAALADALVQQSEASRRELVRAILASEKEYEGYRKGVLDVLRIVGEANQPIG